ncbi:MAG: hypothetical protein KGP28_06540 [Bdellovibrionales bacterium]|nr:hypothetical protein [Bdellovibrionales bacterium]
MWTRLILILSFSFAATDAWAQAQRGSNPPDMNLQTFRPRGTIPSIGEILKNFHGSYAVSYMGPRINGSPEETYNVFIPDVAPVQLFHSLKLGYQATENLQIGVGADIVQNMVNGVMGSTGIIRGRTSEWYDPYLYFDLPNLIQVDGWFVFTSASFSLPVGPASLASAKITSMILQQSWNLNTSSPFSFGFGWFLNPQFYNDPIPQGFTDRQTLFLSFGPNLGFALSKTISIRASASFNVEHRSPNPNGLFHLSEALPDTARGSLSWSPDISPLFVSFGGYVQSVLWSPSFDTSIVGANFSIGF